MAWDRGKSNCAVRTCRQPADYSVLLLITTSGGRRTRKQASSGAVRLCRTCVEQIAGGELPEVMHSGVKHALKSVKQGE